MFGLSPVIFVLVLFAVGIILLIAELMLPAQGVLGVLGGIAIVWAVGYTFTIHQWVGVAVMLATLAASPFAVQLALHVWPKTPVGRRVVLQPVDSLVQMPRVGVGQIGVASSELRPTGLCDFEGARHEARSESGVIRNGQTVQVAAIVDGKLIVRSVN